MTTERLADWSGMPSDPFGWPPVEVNISAERKWWGWRALVWTWEEKEWIRAATKRGLVRKARGRFQGYRYAHPVFVRPAP